MKVRRNNAFTVVELVVVIAVIGILATITAVGYTKLQRDTRDTERQSDIAIIESSLETFYEKNGRYPYSTEIQNVSFLNNTLSLPKSALKAPDSTTENSVAYSTSTAPSTAQYLYYPRYATDAACTAAAQPCVKYQLRWRKESDNLVQTVQSKYGW